MSSHDTVAGMCWELVEARERVVELTEHVAALCKARRESLQALKVAKEFSGDRITKAMNQLKRVPYLV